MATIAGTITLSENDVLTETIASALTGVGKATVAKILQVGSGVSDWVVNDTVLYNSDYALSFREDGNTFQVISYTYIRLKYEAAP